MFAAGRRKFCGCYGVLLNQKSCILPWFCSSLPLQAWSPADRLYLAIWEQQHEELELVSVRKDSQSAILSLLFTACQAPEKHLHVQCGESISKDGPGSPRWSLAPPEVLRCLKTGDWEGSSCLCLQFVTVIPRGSSVDSARQQRGGGAEEMEGVKTTFFLHPYNTCLGETEGSLLFFPEAMCLLWRGQHSVPVELSGCLCDVFVLS